MNQWGKTLGYKSNVLSLSPNIHMVERENLLIKFIL